MTDLGGSGTTTVSEADQQSGDYLQEPRVGDGEESETIVAGEDDEITINKSYFQNLRSPAVVMASLGIVNAVELTFAAMFVALLIWSLANYLHVSFGHLHMHTPGVKVWEAKFRSVSLRLGYIGNTCWAFLFFPVTRGSSILPLVGLTSESSIKYHIWLGHVSLVLFTLHSIGFIIYWWAMSHQMYLMLEWSSTYLSNVAGVIAFVLSRRSRLVSARLLPNGTMELSFAKNPVASVYVSTEGPYGPASTQFLSHESLVMISGGSGLAPFISIIREIISKSTESDRNVPKVLLITAFKNTTDLTMLDLLLPLSGTPLDISKLQLQIEAYVTREHERPIENTNNQIETKMFKTNPLDSPISAALGKNSWLWLGAIISSSFVMFLILLGFVTRYHIYPVEKRGENYHYSFKLLWDMFLVCASVFVATSAVFLWQKRKISAEGKQIQNVDMATPTMSPSSWLCGSDRELESLPHQSLVQSTNVHFGSRPDLRRILFDCKESDVGVLVCGPKSLRHEVAKICASGLAKNLHFESISFNW
ncbi:hypothetical protein DH2020_009914 [Rehmannia glutinosa]|uniref:FAD-binding FR-type domain-containing protein n=1 Tax=Rehmannia glutinosa TaxID=99300 RepID=A0ABR0X8V6_REHGL